MNLQQTTASIEQLISQGDIDQAMDQLVALLDTDAKYADLAQAARINQAELYQVKSQVLKGTIDTKDAQLSTNQITDKALAIIRQVQTGKFNLGTGPGPSQAWRYYVAGGVVTLAIALLLWQILGKKQDDCPTYGKDKQYRVMVLPFVQTGQDKTGDQALDIADGIDKYISKTPNLRNIAEVKVKYTKDAENKYPSYDEAEVIARTCNVQMIIWGKINQTNTGSYKLDVRYKFLGAGQVYFSGDTTLSNLLKTKDEGQLTLDVEIVAELLYIVLANNAQVPVPNNLLATLIPKNKQTSIGDTTTQSIPDTSTLLVYAQNFTSAKQYDKAIEVYDLLLEKYPTHQESRQKRGALLYAKGDYKAAARDLEVAAPDPNSASSDLLRKRVDANLKSAQPAKAQEDLKTLQAKKSEKNGAWINVKNKEVQDSVISLRKVRDNMENLAKVEPDNKKAKMRAARANNGLGEADRALKQAKAMIQIDPKNTGAVEVAVEALLQNKDTIAARKIINNARSAGVNVKGLEERLPFIPALQDRKKKQ